MRKPYAGEPSGLLCSKCNTAIGLMDESRERMLTAIKYLEDQNAIPN